MLSYARLGSLPEQPVGRVFTKPGSPHMMRVTGPGNMVEKFTGNRKQRALVLRIWRERDAELRERMWTLAAGGGWLSPYAQLENTAIETLRAMALR